MTSELICMVSTEARIFEDTTLSCLLLQMEAARLSYVDMCISVYGYMHTSAVLLIQKRVLIPLELEL